MSVKALIYQSLGADPGFFLGGGALVSCSTSTPINHMFFFFCRILCCIRKPQVISGGEGAHTLHPPPRSAPGLCQHSNPVSRLYPITVTSIVVNSVATALGEGGARATCVAEILKGSLHNDQNV